MSEEDIIEQIKVLSNKPIIGFGIIEFEKDLKPDLKDFKVEINPLFNGNLNDNLRYSFIITSQLKEDWEVEYDNFDKKYIVRRKK